MCFILQHNGHRYASVDDIADQLRSNVDALLDRVRSRASGVTQQLETLHEYRNQFTANLQVDWIVIFRYAAKSSGINI